MRIRNRINLAFLSIFVVILIMLGAAVTYYSYALVKSQISSYLSSSSRARAEHVRTYLEDAKETADISASLSLNHELLKERPGTQAYILIREKIRIRLVETAKIDSKHMYESFVLDSSGKIVVSSDPSQEGKDKSKDAYFLNAKSGPYIKDVYFSESIHKLNYTVSAPITENGGRGFLGVVVSRYNPDKFYAVVKNENGLGDSEENFIINKDKLFLTPSRFLGDSVVLKEKNDTVNASRCFSKEETDYVKAKGYSGFKEFFGATAIVESADYRGAQVVGTHAYIPETNWCLITKVDKSELYRPLNNLLIVLGLIFAGAIGIFFLVSYLVAKTITKPIMELNQGVKNIKDGDLEVKVSRKDKDEVGELSRTFDEMTKALLESRADVDKKVAEQTAELEKKEDELEDQKMAILNVLEDVQEEKNKAIDYSSDLEKFQLAVAEASDHIVITDADGIILFANQAVTRITGYNNEDVIGKKAGSKELWGGNMPAGIYRTFWETIKTKKKPYVGIFNNKRKNGVMYEAAANVSPILDEKGEVKYFVGIERDVTKEKEVDRAKTEFVSLASHQLRTPLSAINWYTEMLLNEDAGNINKEQKEYLDEIYHGNQRMVDLVNSLLNVSRLDLGTFEIDPKPVKIPEIIDDVATEMKHAMFDKKQKYIAKYSKDMPNVKADSKLLRVIIQNLFSNAVKYTPNKGAITVSASYNPKKPKEAFVISVSDTGYGIPESQKDKIFTKLFRADNVRAMDTEGTGLGLYIIKSILDEAGGSVSFESKEGKGTTFVVTLPKDGMKQKAGTKSID
jgi:PAS domain S-box-containing protein